MSVPRPTIRRPWSVLTVLLALALVVPVPAHAQLLDRLGNAARNAAESELERQIERLTREAVRCAITDPECFSTASEGEEEVIFTDEDGEIIVDDDGVPITDRNQAAERAGVEVEEPEEEAAPRPGEGAWANYDFVPGETVLYYEDYEDDRVGDFPRRMEFVRGNWEVVEWEGRRLLRNTGPRGAALKIVLPRDLPERFTIETEAYYTHGNSRIIVATTAPPEGSRYQSIEGNILHIGNNHGTGVTGGSVESMNPSKEVGETLTPIRLMVDGSYAKAYVGERRVANVPNAEFARTNTIYLENIYNGDPENPLLFGPIRIAEGGLDLYDRLAADGRVATRGILFDVNSATIRPESTPTLEEIGTMLQDHSDLRIRIEGHTDATGDDASNQALSEERAAAVRAFLVERYGIDDGRLESQGLGESAPVDSNDTPEGRQNNRRVELVRLGG